MGMKVYYAVDKAAKKATIISGTTSTKFSYKVYYPTFRWARNSELQRELEKIFNN